MSFTLPKLNYDYGALEPHIDAKTMEIHYSKHHQAYVNNLNAAIEETEIASKELIDIVKNISQYPTVVRNNGGGHINHSLFWQVIGPEKTEPTGALLEAINSKFDSLDSLKEKFAKVATTRFGSGWAWLVVKNGELDVCSTANQDNPLMDVENLGTPILGLDVWEHAYYLNYQNRRPDYIKAFWNIVNWNKVAELLAKV